MSIREGRSPKASQLLKNTSIPVLLVTPANGHVELRRNSYNGQAKNIEESSRSSSFNLFRQNALEKSSSRSKLKSDSKAISNPECDHHRSPKLSDIQKFFARKISHHSKSCDHESLDLSPANTGFSQSTSNLQNVAVVDENDKEIIFGPTMSTMISKWIRRAMYRSSRSSSPSTHKSYFLQTYSTDEVDARRVETSIESRRKKMIRSETLAGKSHDIEVNKINENKKIRSTSFIHRQDKGSVKTNPLMSPKTKRIRAFAKHIQHSLDPTRIQSISSTPTSSKGEVYKGEEDQTDAFDPKSFESLRNSMELSKYTGDQEKSGNILLMSNPDNTSITGRREKKEKKNKNFDVRDLFHVIFNPNQPGQSEIGMPTISDEISLSTYNLAGSQNLLPIGINQQDHSHRKESIGIGHIFNFKSSKIASPNAGSSPTKAPNMKKSVGLAKFNPTDGSISINHSLLKSGSLSRGLNKPTLKNLQRWEKSFDCLLGDEIGLYLFTEFLKTEFSQENIEFWIACEEYKKLSGSKMTKEAQRIYRTHLSVQSPKEVNLDSKTRLQTIASLNAPNRLVFDAAQKKIQALMEKDSYRRFLRSQTYSTIKNQLEEDQNLSCSTPKSPNSSQKQVEEETTDEMPMSPKLTISPNEKSDESPTELKSDPKPDGIKSSISITEEQNIVPNPVSDTQDCKLSSPELL